MKLKYLIGVVVAVLVIGGLAHLILKNTGTSSPGSSGQTENPISGHIKTYAPAHFGL